MSNPILKALARKLLKQYQQENTDPNQTTVDAAIVIEHEEGVPGFLSVKDIEPNCDINLMTSKLEAKRRAGLKIAGLVFFKANVNVAKTWTVPYCEGNATTLNAAEKYFKRLAEKEKKRWNQAKR